MLNHRFRIFSSLLIAFVIVKIFANFADVKNLLTNIKFPSYNFGNLFTLNFDSSNNGKLREFNNSGGSVDFTQISPMPVLPTQYVAPTTIIKGSGNPTPTNRLYPVPTSNTGLMNQTPTSIPTQIPTKIPKPTKIQKPTATPVPPPITSYIRPGTTLRGVFEEVSKRVCMPTALLLAFQTEESGAFFNPNNPASTIKIYNTYGWWNTGAGDSCFGLGYNTSTGIVPADSNMAGTRCRNGVGGDDLKIMGLLQVSEEEQTLTRKYTIKTLPNNIDRRVIFDNALIFSIATNNRIGVTPKNCNDWTDNEVQIAAEKHYGSCYISATRNYCNEVLKLYKQYR